MAEKKLKITAEKIKSRERRLRLLKIALLIIIIFLILAYVILRIIYEVGAFTVTLDSAYNTNSCLVIYENSEQKIASDVLKADKKEFMTNISGDWIPKDINDEADGTHNGANYIAYTFYAENIGKEVINYWSKITVDDVIKGADEAIRIKVIKDGEETVYAKQNKSSGEPEPNTTPFHEDGVVMLNKTENFKPGDINKYTVVIWIEGDDPECVDNIIGGEVKMHMNLTEEHIEQEES